MTGESSCREHSLDLKTTNNIFFLVFIFCGKTVTYAKAAAVGTWWIDVRRQLSIWPLIVF